MQAGPLLSQISPSFNSYSTSSGKNLAEIAARVVNELRLENGSGSSSIFDPIWETEFSEDNFDYPSREIGFDSNPDGEKPEIDEEEEEDENGEFEFAFVCREQTSSPISADEIFYNGQIKPIYPLFDQNLLRDHEVASRNDVVSSETKTQSPPTTRRRQPLRKLMVEEERETTSSSSSEAEELENLPQDTFCVWTPKHAASEASPGRCKKSSSTGTSSKRWSFRDLLSRSHSDGKETFMFISPGKLKAGKGSSGDRKVAGKGSSKIVAEGGDDREEYLKRNGSSSAKEDEKRRSFLPYKQDLVGFLANVNGLSRNLRPF
ncbi:hypothetical protein UlMin_007987 [Ulmus minor]